MPTYEYTCTSCGEELEVVQSFSDDPLTVCPACEGRLRKVFSPVGVVFKGSGFYKTDSRTAKKKQSASSGASGSATDGSGSDGAAAGGSGGESGGTGDKASGETGSDKSAGNKAAGDKPAGEKSAATKPAAGAGSASGDRVA